MGKKKDTCSKLADNKKEIVLKRLREEKYRITNQRLMLLDIILEGDFACCKEIYYQAVKKDPSIGASTVYRMMNILEDIGVINRKNLYNIQCVQCEEKEGICKITLNDQTEIELTEKKWKQVILSGLQMCGFTSKEDLKSIEFI